MICQIVATGTELMNGMTLDTNSNYIMKELYRLGIETDKVTVISDDRMIMYKEIEQAIEESDLIYISGGLGPTEDDHTKDIVAEILDLKLVLDEDILLGLEESYEKRNMDMPSNNKQQALKPKGSQILYNDYGTAPGFFIEKANKKIFLLPGPPRELIPMFKKTLAYLPDSLAEKKIEIINTLGIGESKLEMILKTIDKDDSLEVLTYAKDRRVDIQILYDESLDRHILNSYIESLYETLGDYIYGRNFKSIEEMLLYKSKEKNIGLAFAESCTGGLLASRLTDVSGASTVLEKSIVTYTNKAKEEELGVAKETLKKYGAISKETAKEMAKGIKKNSAADLTISITGVAGPGKEEGKDEGLVYIGLAGDDIVEVKKYNFKGSRKIIKSLAASQAFIDAIKFIEKI